jgi:hypothetical protein
MKEMIFWVTQNGNVGVGISGNTIFWESNNGVYYAQIAANGTEASEFVITTTTEETQWWRPQVSGDWVVWEDGRNYPYGMEGESDIYAYNMSDSTERKVSSDKLVYTYMIDHMSDYFMVVVGGEGSGRVRIDVFDKADSLGVNILGLHGLVQTLSWPPSPPDAEPGPSPAARFGIRDSSSVGQGNEVYEIEAVTTSHPIFDGLDTTGKIFLDNGNATADTYSWAIKSSGDDRPADWTVLAAWGDNTNGDAPGEAAIVEFTTPMGTTVILHGPICELGQYQWTEDHWKLVTNEVLYLKSKE